MPVILRGFHETACVDESAEAVLQPGGVEIHEKTERQSAHAEVSLELVFVRDGERGNAFDFDDDGVRHQDIGAEAHGLFQAPVNNRDTDLPLDRNAGLFEFAAQAGRLHRFQQPRPGASVNLDRKPDDMFRE